MEGLQFEHFSVLAVPNRLFLPGSLTNLGKTL